MSVHCGSVGQSQWVKGMIIQSVCRIMMDASRHEFEIPPFFVAFVFFS